MAYLLVALASVSARVYASNPIGSKGFTSIDTPGFTLELDVANQVASRLIAKPGGNAGSSPFNFLLPTQGRTDDGYYVGRSFASVIPRQSKIDESDSL